MSLHPGRKSPFAAALAIVIVAACGPTVQYAWTKPGANSAEYERDRYECYREAAAVPQIAYPSGSPPRYPAGGGYAEGFRYGQAQAAYQARVDQGNQLPGV